MSPIIPEHEVAPTQHKQWRESLLSLLVVLFSVISLPVLINEVIYREDWLVPVLAWLVLPLLVATRGMIGLWARAGVLTAMLLLLGAWTIYSAGLMGGGRTLMGAATILGALLLGRRFGLAMFAMSCTTIGLIGWAAVTGLIGFAAPFDESPNTFGLWGSYFGTFVIGVGVMLTAVLYVTETLEDLADNLRTQMRRREEVEAAERESSQQIHFLTDHINDILWTADLDLNFTYISDSILRTRGYTPEEVKQIGLAGSLALESPEFAKALLDAELSKEGSADPNRSVRLETRLTTKDGRGIDAEINVSFIRDDDGQPIGIIGVTRDISERKRLESAMDSVIRGARKSGDAGFFDALTENLANVLGAHTVFIGRLTGVDDVETISGWQQGSHIENFTYSLRHTPCAEVFERSLCSYGRDVQSQFPDDEMLVSMGIEAYVGTVLTDDDDKPIGILACFDDKPIDDVSMAEDLLTIFAAHASLELSRQQAVEERESISVQLQQAQKLESVGQLTGGIAHDFNNLLVVIQGFAELAEESAEGNQLLKDCLKGIREGTDRAAALTRQLLSFSRRQVIDTRPIDPAELLERSTAMLSRLLPESIEYSLDVEPGLYTIKADAGQIEQAIVNLVLNARDAMPNGGVLRVSARNVVLDAAFVDAHPGSSAGGHILVTVADTGEGMSPEVIERVFEPFFTTKPDGLGTGLGLSVVFGIVKQHSGFIDLQSRPDEGTEVRLYLPASDRHAEDIESDARMAVRGGSETILVVEDEPAVRTLASTFLTREGYCVIEAEDGERAVDQFAAHRQEISLVLLDVVLPKLNGREVMDRIRAIDPSARVLLTSGYSADGIHTGFVLEEDLLLLQKPYKRDSLLRKVRETLDAPLDRVVPPPA